MSTDESALKKKIAVLNQRNHQYFFVSLFMICNAYQPDDIEAI